jgi:hypothetical protein
LDFICLTLGSLARLADVPVVVADDDDDDGAAATAAAPPSD